MLQYFTNLLSHIINFIMNIFGFVKPSIQPSDSLQVFVRTNHGEQIIVTLKPSMSVKKIKSDIAEKLKFSADHLKIIFAGKELPDDLLFEQCDIGSKSILHVVRVERKFVDSTIEFKTTHDISIPNKLKDSCDTKPKIISNLNLEAENDSDFLSQEIPSSYEEPNHSRSLNVNRTKLLCDASTVITIQLSEKEREELQKLKVTSSNENPHFYVYCIGPCAGVRIGKLRVRCVECKSGAITLHRDPASWTDVLVPKVITGSCENPNCHCEYAEFYFKCREHETQGEDDTAVVLYLIRVNLPRVPCLACTDISSPIIVFECSKSHVMCLDCYVTYCISRLNERQFVRDDKLGYTLPCPVGCPDSLIKEIHHFKLMGDQHYERYQRFATEEVVLAAGGVFCPRPGCGQGILPDEDCRRVKCINGCDYVFCKDCLQGYHIGDCILDNAYFDSTISSSGFALDPERVAMSRWDEASNITIKVMTKPCPKCRTPTERDGGCMHMVCTRASCQFHWCWVCQTEWTRECMAAHWFG